MHLLFHRYDSVAILNKEPFHFDFLLGFHLAGKLQNYKKKKNKCPFKATVHSYIKQVSKRKTIGTNKF